MLGHHREKPGKADSSATHSQSNSASSKRSSGQPYLHVPTLPASSPSSMAAVPKSSQTSILDPVRKSSSKKLQPKSSLRKSYINNNYGKSQQPHPPNNEIKSNRIIGISGSRSKSRESSQTSLSKRTSGKSMMSSTGSFADNSDERSEEGPNNENLSADIAKAVATIVAEYEILQQKEGNDSEPEAAKEETQTKANKTKDANGDGTALPSKDNQKANSTKKREVKGNDGDNGKAHLNAAAQPTSNNNAPTDPTPSGVVPAQQQPQPGTSSVASTISGKEPAAAEPTQSSQLPVKPECVKRDSLVSNKESNVSIGLELPKELAAPKKSGFVRCSVPAPTPTREAKLGGQAEVMRYLTRVQQYINALGYHREGEPATGINVRLSMKTHMLTAKDLIQAGRPIKCLHAVVLCVHLTNALDTVERFPIYFRSHVGDREYRHIVLGIYCQGHFGALGISRDLGLQDKKLIYTRLSDLIFEYSKCYQESGHILNEVKLGTIITHDQSSLEKLFNKIGAIPIHNYANCEIEANVEKMAKQLRARMGLACLKSVCLDNKNISANSIIHRSRSRGSITVRNVSNNAISNVSKVSSIATSATAPPPRPRALSLGPIMANSIRNKSDDKMTTINSKINRIASRNRSNKPPKSKRK